MKLLLDENLSYRLVPGPPPVVIRLVLGNYSNAQVLHALTTAREHFPSPQRPHTIGHSAHTMPHIIKPMRPSNTCHALGRANQGAKKRAP